MNDEAKLVNQQELRQHDRKLPDDALFYFKFVGIARTVLEKNDHDPAKICDLVDEQAGFFLIGESSTQVREALHQLVDRFMDAHE